MGCLTGYPNASKAASMTTARSLNITFNESQPQTVVVTRSKPRVLKIQSHVPLPEDRKTSITAQVKAMQIGQSFFTTHNSDCTAAYELNRCAANGKVPRYTCRVVVEGGVKGFRVFRIK